MLETVDVGTQPVDSLAASAGEQAVAELRRLAAPLRGLRVLHVNATPYGGGVAELLRSQVPLLRDLGLRAEWKLITGDEDFFKVTKTIHNGLQGAERELTAAERKTYEAHSVRNAELLEEAPDYDVIVIHDPQPLALPQYADRGPSHWIWRCHIDTSRPNPAVWAYLRPHTRTYDAAVFTLRQFIPEDFPVARVAIIPPAIDPESPKNVELSPGTSRRVIQWFGVDLERPLVTQVSRFDPWKDPLGVIDAYRQIKDDVPGLQLALVGSMALDDPEGWEVYREIQSAARSDHSIYTLTNLTGVSNIEVNAFQRLSQVVVQKSVREGFGLVVSETLWKGTPMVAGRAGGIPMQMSEGVGGFLVDSVEACAERMLWLLNHRQEARDLGAAGREHVRSRFLVSRMLADELRLYDSLVNGDAPAGGDA